MPTKKLSTTNRKSLEKLGKRIEHIIIKEKGYKSLDAFSLENYDEIAKPTLYDICAGKRDMKLSTLLGLSRALNISAGDLLENI